MLTISCFKKIEFYQVLPYVYLLISCTVNLLLKFAVEHKRDFGENLEFRTTGRLENVTKFAPIILHILI
jgi:hypothetical protein